MSDLTIRTMQHTFAYYGFIECPLSDSELEFLLRNGFTEDQIYSIGCDVEAGVDFNHAMSASWPDETKIVHQTIKTNYEDS